MKPRAISNTLSFAENFFTPMIVVIPQFSSHEERLLLWLSEQNSAVNQDNIINTSNYTVINQNNENVGIEMVRDLIGVLSYGSYEGRERTIAILQADTATIPAQNALLKLLEEPPVGTKIYLTVEDPDKLLETIISRCVVVRAGDGDFTNDADIAENTVAQLERTRARQEKTRAGETKTAKLQALTHTISSSSYRELIELAEQYKERADAVQLMKELLAFFHAKLEREPRQSIQPTQAAQPTLPHHRLALEIILKELDGLQRNGNVRLILEDCFFRLKELE